MLTSVVGSLRIELSAAFSMTGANTCPMRVIARRLGDRGRQDVPDHGSQALGVVHYAG